MLVCRKRAGRPIEGLLVHRRYTYSFAEFVHGHHQGLSRPQELKALLSGMTVGELILVQSGDFERMYDFLWANQKMDGDLYERKAGKFAHCFVRRPQNLQALKNLVAQVRPTGRLWWEPPKGRQNRPHESGVTTAVREVEEEAGIARKCYNILPGYQREERYGSAVVYHHIYFAAAARGALARGGAQPVLQMKNPAQIAEVDGVRWMTADEMRGVDHDGRLGATVIRLMRQVSRGWYGRQDLANPGRRRRFGSRPWRAPESRSPVSVKGGGSLRELKGTPGVLVLPEPGADGLPLKRMGLTIEEATPTGFSVGGGAGHIDSVRFDASRLTGRETATYGRSRSPVGVTKGQLWHWARAEDSDPKGAGRNVAARGELAGGDSTHPPKKPPPSEASPPVRGSPPPDGGGGWQVVGPSGSRRRR